MFAKIRFKKREILRNRCSTYYSKILDNANCLKNEMSLAYIVDLVKEESQLNTIKFTNLLINT